MRQETPDEENNEYRALERTDEGNEEFDMRCLSLGAGVQSSAMILMADRGDFGDVPEHAIFADTQSEPPWVYEHLSWLESEIKHIKIHRVTAGSLENDVLKSRDGPLCSTSPCDVGKLSIGSLVKTSQFRRKARVRFVRFMTTEPGMTCEKTTPQSGRAQSHSIKQSALANCAA